MAKRNDKKPRIDPPQRLDGPPLRRVDCDKPGPPIVYISAESPPKVKSAAAPASASTPAPVRVPLIRTPVQPTAAIQPLTPPPAPVPVPAPLPTFAQPPGLFNHVTPPAPAPAPEYLEPILLDPESAAALLSISARTLYELGRRGEIPSVRIGRLVRYSLETLRAWAKKNERFEKNDHFDIEMQSPDRTIERSSRSE